LPVLASGVLVPPAVVTEIAAGRGQGIDLPELTSHSWITIRAPVGPVSLPASVHLGPGELEVLALTGECADAVAVLDDRLARRAALSLGLRLPGTLGLLFDAKRAGLFPAIEPSLDDLQRLGFRISAHTRAAVLKLAGETP
jgi:predicted nucleic acid-binding protein